MSARLVVWRILVDNTAGALSGPVPRNGFFDPVPPWGWTGYAGQAERDAKARAWLRWTVMAWEFSRLGALWRLEVASRSGGSANVEDDTIELEAGFFAHALPRTTDETTGLELVNDAALRRAAARPFVYDLDPRRVTFPATDAPRDQRFDDVTASAPITGASLAAALTAAEAQITVTLRAGTT